MNFEDKKIRKKNKHVAKKKVQPDNVCAPVQATTTGFAAFLFFCLAFISCFEFSASLSSCFRSRTCLLPLSPYPGIPTASLSCLMPASVLRSPAILSPLPILGLTPPNFASTTLRAFKQVLSN